MEKHRSNIPLIFALAIPVAMILLVAVSIYLPSFFVAPPQHNFLYTHDDMYTSETFYCDGQSYPYGPTYVVENNKVVKKTYEVPEKCSQTVPIKTTEGKLFFYNVKENKSREVGIEEARAFFIDPAEESPDGFRVDRGGEDFGLFPILFGGVSDYNTLYITKNGYSKKLNLTSRQGYYPYNFQFLGWVDTTSVE